MNQPENGDSVTDLAKAARTLEKFTTGNLRGKIAAIERDLRSFCGTDCKSYLIANAINGDLLLAAQLLKNAVGQIHVVFHAAAILLLIPHLLQECEIVESLSLGAGNAGKQGFDMETSHRIAEFTFIRWRGNDSRRQDKIFEDFYKLAEFETAKLKHLFVTGKEALRFFEKSGRAIRSVAEKSRGLWSNFTAKYAERFQRVRDYYEFLAGQVSIIDVEPFLAQLGVAEPVQ